MQGNLPPVKRVGEEDESGEPVDSSG
ncbi:MAG: hypothetical protein J07HX64_01017 [halophilic archaeon J07HX64]|nr:MAG: hypothetical protein J07HX64_01017 [halophilic archaeon J07HX64]